MMTLSINHFITFKHQIYSNIFNVPTIIKKNYIQYEVSTVNPVHNAVMMNNLQCIPELIQL